jgi:hypothetical protein
MRDVITDVQAIEELTRIEAMQRQLDAAIRRYDVEIRAWVIRELGGK